MGKKAKKVKGSNREKVKAGDVFAVSNSVEVVDVDGDGVSDLVVKHNVLKNDAKFVESQTVWYGLENEVLDAFLAALEEEGLGDETFETTKFNQVGKTWKKLTRFLGKLNKLADVKATELGEEVED